MKNSGFHRKARKALVYRTVVPALLSIFLFGAMIFLAVIPALEEKLVATKKQMVLELVGTALDTLEYYHGAEINGELTREEAQARAWGDLSKRRFGPQRKDYFWISGPDGRILKHPYRSDLENLSLPEMEATAPGMAAPGYAIAELVQAQGGGFHVYPWQWKDEPGRMVTKVTYVKLFEPWQWVVGSGLYLNDIEHELRQFVNRLAWSGAAVVGIILLLSAYMVLQMIRLHKEHHTTWQALSDSESKHRAMLESAPNAIVVYDNEGRVLFLNQAFTRGFGWQADELLGRRIDFVPPENLAETRRAITEAYANPEFQYHFETRRLTRSGKVLDVIVSAAVFRDARGNALGMVVNLQDVTQNKAVKQALLESEMISKAIADTARDAIVVVDDNGDITFWSKSGFTILGYTADEVRGKSLHNILAPARYHGAYMEGLKQFRVTGTGGVVGKTIELTAVHKDGTEIPVELSLASVKLKGRWHGVGILRDITERKAMIARSQKAQRLESLGTLAGGIAHDFNNLLMGIEGRASLMMAELPADDPHLAYLQGISEHVDSARGLTGQLLGFARSGKYEVKATDMNALVRKTADMFGRTKKEVRLRMALSTETCTCAVDRGQIEQVLLNIYVNAWQAMPGGRGELAVETAVETADDAIMAQDGVSGGDYLKISIADNGQGMTPDVLDRIFEPFFTTKEMGRGTGLGLASAYGIIKNHGGFISVHSEAGQGSRFDIHLPVVEAQAERIPEKSDDVHKGSGTVLLVDDEDLVLEVGRAMLASLGYAVLTADGGPSALEIYGDHMGEIDLVIIDMIMPDMGGEELFRLLREVNPDVKVLLSSGYGANDASISAMVDQCCGFIQKPFNLAYLSQKLRQVSGSQADSR